VDGRSNQRFPPAQSKITLLGLPWNNELRPADILDPDKIIDTSELNKILEVDSKRGVVVSEPNVPMDSL
jgi:hypothetical protein